MANQFDGVAFQGETTLTSNAGMQCLHDLDRVAISVMLNTRMYI